MDLRTKLLYIEDDDEPLSYSTIELFLFEHNIRRAYFGEDAQYIRCEFLFRLFLEWCFKNNYIEASLTSLKVFGLCLRKRGIGSVRKTINNKNGKFYKICSKHTIASL